MQKILLILIMLFGFSTNSYAERFMTAFEEIPLQEGLEEQEPLSFDTEDFRIIEQYITSMILSKDAFLKYYKETLKSLGWNLISSKNDVYSFKREDESLTLTIESENPLVVLFTLKPYGK